MPPNANNLAVVPGQQVTASRSSLVTSIAFIIVAALSYIFAMAMAWILPFPAFGMLGITQSCLLIAATVLNAGFSSELVRVIAHPSTQAEKYRVAKSACIGILGIALLLSLLLLGVTTFSGARFAPEAQTIVGLLILETFLLAAAAFWGAVLQGSLRFGTLGLGQIVEAVVKLLFGVALGWLGFGAEGAVGAIVMGTIPYVVILGWNARHFTFWHEATWATWRTFRNSLGMFVGLSALAVVTNMDIIGLQFFSPSAEAATLTSFYQAAQVLTRISILLAAASASALYPYLARAKGVEFVSYATLAQKYALLIIVPANLVLIAIPKSVLQLIFPAAYHMAARPLQIAALAAIFLVLVNIYVATLHARGRTHLTARYLPQAVVVQLVGLWLLVPHFAMMGAALSFLLSTAFAFGVLVLATRREYTWRLNVVDVVRYGVVSTTFMGLLVVLPRHTKSWTLLSILVTFIVYAVGLLLTGLISVHDLQVLTAGLPWERSRRWLALRDKCLYWIGKLGRE